MLKQIVQLVDDLTGDELNEDGGQTVQFAFNGVEYEIDLSNKNADKMEKALQPYIEAARRVGGRKQRRNEGGSSNKSSGGRRTDLAEVRAWARDNGYQVSDRGRIPNEVLEAYDAH